MRVLISFILLLLFSCSQNQETSTVNSKKEIEKDTLPRIELKFNGEDQIFSIYKIQEFDTIYVIHGNSDTKCGFSEILVYTFKNSLPIEQMALGGFRIDTSFQGMLISLPKYKNEDCHNPIMEIKLYEWKNILCQNAKMLPANKNKPCLLKDTLINDRESIVYLDTILQKGTYSFRMNTKIDSAIVNIDGFWRKENFELRSKIIKSIYSFK
jgi:hypothetical protein